jgi:hypothetical protein
MVRTGWMKYRASSSTKTTFPGALMPSFYRMSFGMVAWPLEVTFDGRHHPGFTWE